VSILLSQATESGSSPLLWGFLLIGATIFLIALELIVPSGGVLAIAAGAALIGSIAAFFTHDTTAGLVALAAVAVLGPLGAWFGWKWWSGTDMAARLVLDDDDATAIDGRDALLGRTGTAETELRPVGVVRIDDRRHDALSEHGVIANGSEIVVVKVLDNQLKVRPAATTSPEEKT